MYANPVLDRPTTITDGGRYCIPYRVPWGVPRGRCGWVLGSRANPLTPGFELPKSPQSASRPT